MVVIRLARLGAKKSPFYDVVATDKRNSRDGRFIEKIGHYNPVAGERDHSPLKINMERFDHWVSQGAKPSPRVLSLIKEIKKQVS